MRPESHSLHQRYGKRTGSYRVGCGTAGNTAHHTTGNHTCLRRAALVFTDTAHRQVDKHPASAGGFQNGTKQYEYEYKLGRRINRCAENTVVPIYNFIYESGKITAVVIKLSGHDFSEEKIGHE